MSKPNINPYYDHDAAGREVSDTPGREVVVVPHAVGDSGMPAWMPITAPFVGLALFGLAAFFAFSLTGHETPPTQAAHQEATQPEKANAPQPAATAQKAQQQGQQGAPPQQAQVPSTPNPTATTGAAPKQQ